MNASVHFLRASLTRTSRNVSEHLVGKNARLLEQAGFVSQTAAGIYTLLPLGLRVLQRIELIIREEMESLQAHEFLGATLQPKGLWETTSRWDSVDVLYKLASRHGGEFCLAATAEELISSVGAASIRSYRDLPFAAYQIGTKYRDEHRARSGLLRGKEFRMKDLYSFHCDQNEMDAFYESVCAAYARVFTRCGIGHAVVRTFASGGIFSRFSDEFQLLSAAGEDTIYVTKDGSVAINKEIAQDDEALQTVFGKQVPELVEHRAIEVGNTFKLGRRFTEAFGIRVPDRTGTIQPLLMCSYGIGSTRLIGAVVETFGDERGLVWPTEISPYGVHVIVGNSAGEERQELAPLVEHLRNAGISALIDDRRDVRLGEKFMDADLIGVPVQVVVGGKKQNASEAEVKRRRDIGPAAMVRRESVVDYIRSLSDRCLE